MKWLALAIIGASLMVNGQEPKPHSNTHKRSATAESQNATDTAGQTVTVVNQHTPQGQDNAHSGKSPSYFHELLSPQNVPSIALVLVGIVGILVAVKSLRRIDKQIIEMRRQVDLTFGQLRAMHEQIAEMSAQTEVFEKSVRAAQDSADATNKAIELSINKERARIFVEVLPISLDRTISKLTDAVTYLVSFHGATFAFIEDTGADAIFTDSKEPPELSEYLHGRVDIPKAVPPESDPKKQVALFYHRFDEFEVESIKHGKSFLHFRGWIKYKDFMGRERETVFCYTWSPKPPAPAFGWEGWIKSGPPEANRET